MKTIAKLHLPRLPQAHAGWGHLLMNLVLLTLLSAISLLALWLLQEAHSYFGLGAYAANEVRGMDLLAQKIFGGAA
ncbi:hypothetical protein V8J88_05015 [Massilia sp. W12]|uniref:hypothetical protein n=1 Tax=Massilia sp. W12 TaxID=3126507 RepID=UPI0030D1C7C9